MKKRESFKSRFSSASFVRFFLGKQEKEEDPRVFPTWQQADSCRTFKDLFRISSLENMGAGPVWEASPRLAPGGLSSGIASLKQDMEYAKSPKHKKP